VTIAVTLRPRFYPLWRRHSYLIWRATDSKRDSGQLPSCSRMPHDRRRLGSAPIGLTFSRDDLIDQVLIERAPGRLNRVQVVAGHIGDARPTTCQACGAPIAQPAKGSTHLLSRMQAGALSQATAQAAR
jgi:hypothetical protein